MHVTSGEVTGFSSTHVIAQDEDIVPELGGIAARRQSVELQNVLHHAVRIAQDHVVRDRVETAQRHTVKEL